MKCDNNYKLAEHFSGVISSIFKMDCKPQDLIHDDDEVANNALYYHDSLEKLLKDVSFINREDILAFCKAMEHYNKGWCWLNSEGHAYMADYCDNLLGYLTGHISKKELERRFVFFKLWEGGKPIKGNLCLARRTFRQIEELYYEIVCKKEIRMVKKKKMG